MGNGNLIKREQGESRLSLGKGRQVMVRQASEGEGEEA